VAGKLDWLAAGLPTEGTNAGQPRAGDIARRDVPTCLLDESLGEVRGRVQAVGWDACVVVNSERIVLGLLRASEIQGESSLPIHEAMRPGPSTFRPHVAVDEIARAMAERDRDSVPITTSDGRLVGLLRRSDATEALPHGEPESQA
jgi:CBS domain-containing protein